eukprot:1100_1
MTTCDQHVKDCEVVRYLLESIELYNIDCDPKQYNINQICESFTHALQYHDNEDYFEYIYNTIESKCNLEHCSAYQRNNRDRKLMKNNNIRNKTYSIHSDHKRKHKYQTKMIFCQIMDKIHCYYCHSYDVKYRLTPQQRTFVYDTSCDQVENNLSSIRSEKMQRLRSIVSECNPTSRGNRFVSNLGIQYNKPDEIASNKKTYSYGVRFYYWPYFRDLDEPDYDHNVGYTFSDWYINNKYTNIKDETINPSWSVITVEQWDNEFSKAEIYLTETYAKQLCADSDKKMYHKHRWNISHYGIEDGSIITSTQLLCVMLYCNFDQFQNMFSKTFRRINENETDVALKKRHSNYFHLAKFIRECVEIFGTKIHDGTYKHFYHGIDQVMLFQQLSAFIYGLLSTSAAINVAIKFANNTGMVVEFYPHNIVKYFNCNWVSDFGNERELLFVGGRNCLVFQNIINIAKSTEYVEEYRGFVLALTVLDKQRAMQLYETDKTVKLKLDEIKESSLLSDTLKQIAKPIPKALQKIVIALINHEMSRYNLQKYKRWVSLNTYVDDLLHFICSERAKVYINLYQMNIDVAEQYSKGYQGYKFLKHFFCHPEYGWINLQFITTLYPNCDWIYVSDIPILNQDIFDDIIAFFTNNMNSNVKQIALRISNHSKEKPFHSKESIDTIIHNNMQTLKAIAIEVHRKEGYLSKRFIGINIVRIK